MFRRAKSVNPGQWRYRKLRRKLCINLDLCTAFSCPNSQQIGPFCRVLKHGGAFLARPRPPMAIEKRCPLVAIGMAKSKRSAVPEDACPFLAFDRVIRAGRSVEIPFERLGQLCPWPCGKGR
jgi:hypothetical protein